MKKSFLFPLGLLLLAGLPGCNGGSKKPVVVQPEMEEQEVQDVKKTADMRPQPIKQARASGPMQKEVGWDDEDYS